MAIPPIDAVSTVAAPVHVEIEKIKGSRFICDLAPADDAGAAAGFVDMVRSRERAATHHCWAYRFDTGESRSSDDGEPGGTAGPPILRRIEAAGLVDVVAVVTRYYGGTNLGTGGLIRAYGSATAAAIHAASLVHRNRTVVFQIEHPYHLSAGVGAVLASFDAEVVSSSYSGSVTLVVRVPADRATTFNSDLGEATAGVVSARPADG